MTEDARPPCPKCGAPREIVAVPCPNPPGTDVACGVMHESELQCRACDIPAAEPQDTAPRAQDIPCPKCGGADVDIHYCDGCQLRHFSAGGDDDRCEHGDPEHFHRACRRCSYRWRTDDALGARKVCKG